MSATGGNIWAVCVVMLCVKALSADLYIAYFKWRQARDACRAAQLEAALADSIVVGLENTNTLVLLGALSLCVVVICLLLRPEYHFPFLTLFGVVSSFSVATFSAIGDYVRAQTFPRG